MDRADAFRIAAEQGDIVLDLGQTDGEAPVRVTDRILLDPVTAQRLLLSLDEALRPHENALRAAEAQALPPEQAARLLEPDAADPALLLQQSVAALGAPFHREGSFRVSPGKLSRDRFLLTYNVRDVAGDARARSLAIAARLGLPHEALAAAAEAFTNAACVHFGFEGDPGASIVKLYLERAIAPAHRDAAARAEQPLPLHLAFKWDLATRRMVTSRYVWFPALPPGIIAARIQRMFNGSDPRAAMLAQAALQLAAHRLPVDRMQYLEVIEDGTPRQSFDLKLYGSGLLVRDALPILSAMRDLFGIRPGQFQTLLDEVQMQPLGHVAGGVHRAGEPFFNIYCGATQVA